jgi:hypothetical protein
MSPRQTLLGGSDAESVAPALGLAVELYALIALVIVLRRGRAAFAMSLPLAPFMAAGSLLALLI